jgi:hypothetical protein
MVSVSSKEEEGFAIYFLLISLCFCEAMEFISFWEELLQAVKKKIITKAGKNLAVI